MDEGGGPDGEQLWGKEGVASPPKGPAGGAALWKGTLGAARWHAQGRRGCRRAGRRVSATAPFGLGPGPRATWENVRWAGENAWSPIPVGGGAARAGWMRPSRGLGAALKVEKAVRGRRARGRGGRRGGLWENHQLTLCPRGSAVGPPEGGVSVWLFQPPQQGPGPRRHTAGPRETLPLEGPPLGGARG